MHTPDLSIVIPLDFHRRSWDLYRRVKRFVHMFAGQSVQLIFGCNAAPQFWVKCLQRLIAKHANMHVCLVDAEASSLSKLRNVAIAAVKTKYVMFLDIDIVPDLDLVDLAYQQTLNHPKQISMFPCLYLSKQGSKLIYKQSAQEFIEQFFDFRRDLILHLAFPSSIIISDIASVREIHGFDEQFVGHGYEDFDFMLQLFHHKGLIEYSADILVDEPYLAPLMSVGLRAALAKPFLDSLIQPIYFLHQFHKKDKEEGYYKKRDLNKNKFIEKYQRLKKENIHFSKLTLLNCFFNEVIEEKNSPKYGVLWAELRGGSFRKIKLPK
ncbi:galactosyltransferase-related protein [Acinetobacter sp. F9]|uniref:galactosyltransferase-related protein n=1 Tax=Acinetobacter sp. F9 TaxID=2853158 RepID=UPI001E2F9B89|nr:galactosyltransferase-related protein [Acinetobacter sp. F9]